MRIEEARWIYQAIDRYLSPAADGPRHALNLGSGTKRSREQGKPHIHQLTIAPLIEKGYRVIHSDMIHAEGVDLIGDLFDPQFQKTLAELRPEIVMFCNILEHLPREKRGQVPHILHSILAPGGVLIVTVPYSYPYHADPIDTMYRPSPDELAALFSQMRAIQIDILISDCYGDEFFKNSMSRKIGRILRLCIPFVRPKRWLSHAHRFCWLYRPYKITAGLFRAPPVCDAVRKPGQHRPETDSSRYDAGRVPPQSENPDHA